MKAKLLAKALRKGIIMSIEAYVAIELILMIKVIRSQAYNQSHFLLNFMKLSGILLITVVLTCIIYSLFSTVRKKRGHRVYYCVKFL